MESLKSPKYLSCSGSKAVYGSSFSGTFMPGLSCASIFVAGRDKDNKRKKRTTPATDGFLTTLPSIGGRTLVSYAKGLRAII